MSHLVREKIEHTALVTPPCSYLSFYVIMEQIWIRKKMQMSSYHGSFVFEGISQHFPILVFLYLCLVGMVVLNHFPYTSVHFL